MSIRDELQVLESIYPDFVASNLDNFQSTLQLLVPVEFARAQNITIFEPDGRLPDESLSVSVLPPLVLNIDLLESYPLTNPPGISIRSTHSWLPGFAKVSLRASMLNMWNGDEILCSWVEYILSGDFLLAHQVDGHLRIPHPAPHLLAPLLRQHDVNSQSSQFSKNTYSCSICLEYHKGSKCLELSCNHVFCRHCLEDFWGMCIREGDVARVGCPNSQCIKEKRESTESEVSRVVTEEEVQRWRWLKEKLELEKDPTLLPCPVSFCQRLVPKPLIREGEESAWDRLRTCSHCSYSFCAFCKRTWHGPVTMCPISASETLVLEYLELEEHSEGRAALERRFGKNNIIKLIKNYREEQANKAFIDSSTTPCPNCHVRIEKSLGCNHITCSKCDRHFCYRCGEKLNAAHPYSHFSTPGTGCYNKLFDVEQEWEALDWM